MELEEAFGITVRKARDKVPLVQEDFHRVISREALSLIERGRRSPRLDQIDAICSTIGVHPLSLLARAYLLKTPETSLSDLFARISSEIKKIEEPPADNPFTEGT